MKVFQRKSRLVSFRVSESDYERLREAVAAHGLRGVSDVARFAVSKMFVAPDITPIEEQDGLQSMDANRDVAIAKLTRNLEQLTSRIEELATLLDLLKSSPRQLGAPRLSD